MSITVPASVADIVRMWSQRSPDEVCLHAGGVTRTWAELDARSSQLANALGASGVGPRDRVAILDKNGLEYFEVLFACSKLNAVPISVNWRLAAPEIEYTLNDSMVTVLFVGPEFIPIIESIEQKFTTLQTIVSLGPHPGYVDYEAFFADAAPADPNAAVTMGDVALQLYTSGTTGLPKGVMTTTGNIFALLGKVVTAWNFDQETKNLVAMPLFHVAGCGWAIAAMYAGGTSYVVRDFNPQAVLDLMVHENITNAFLVPAMLAFMCFVPGAAEQEFPHLRAVVYGASPITTPTLLAAMQVFKAPFVQLYGMTETTGAITELTSADHDPAGPKAALLRSAGRPYPWVELRVVSLETGAACAPGEVGEFWTRSAQNMAGYWNKPAETARTITEDGWLKTGDAGYLDADGYVFLTDRVKDMIVSGGENVYPIEVENVLDSHPLIKEVGVIGVPSERWGETVKAMVVLMPDTEVSDALQAELIAFCKARLASFKCPTSVDFIDALPRNPTGKILKKDLRAPFWVGRDRQIN